MIDEDYDEIYEKAYRKYLLHQRGIRGQTVEVWDSLEYWIYLETKEKYETK